MTVAPGTHLIEQGKAADFLYFVLDGAFVVYTPTAPRIAVLKAGEVVGEISFVDSRPPVAGVRAEADVLQDALVAVAKTDMLERDVAAYGL